MTEIQKAQYRLDILKKIEEFEKNELWEQDIDNNPSYDKLNPEKIDFVRKKLLSKIKAFIATKMGKRFFESMMKKKEVIFAGYKGIENLKNFKRGAIVTCNHFSVFDSYAVLLALKKQFRGMRLHRVVREGNFAFPGKLGFLMRNGDTLPISTEPSLMNACMNAIKILLAKNKKILIYPEQAMWWNYRKPRPLKRGAFLIAAKCNSPIIPCFITLKDSDIIGSDGFHVQEFTVHILPVIYPDDNLSVKQNCDLMKDKNFELWKNTYESVYGIPLKYLK